MGGLSLKSRLLFPVLDEEKSFHAIFGLEWGVCAWIWSWPELTKAVSIGTVPSGFLLVALKLLTSAPHSLVYFLLSVFESLLLRARFLEQTSFLIWDVGKYAHTAAYIKHSGSQNQGEGCLRKGRMLVREGRESNSNAFYTAIEMFKRPSYFFKKIILFLLSYNLPPLWEIVFLLCFCNM